MRTPFAEKQVFAPPAITIVGASERRAASRSLLRNLTESAATAYPGPIRLVNRSGRPVDGRPTVRSPADLDGEPGLVFLMIPAAECVPVLDSMPARPTGVVAYCGGSESGHAAAEEALRAWAEGNDVPLIGLQSTGFVRPADRAIALVAPLRRAPAPGRVALIMQSSGLLGGTVNALTARGIGLDTGVSLGNGTALSAADVGGELLRRPSTACLLLYLDAIADLDAFAELARLAQRSDRPVVLCLGGQSAVGGELVRSHTGQLATDHRVAEGVARQYDVILVDDIDGLVLAAETFEQAGYRQPVAGGVGVMATSGGACAVVADALSRAGVPLPGPRPDLLRSAGVGSNDALNPLDLGAAALDSPEAMERAMRAFIDDDALAIHLTITAPGLPASAGSEAGAQQGQVTAFVRLVTAAGKLPVLAAPVSAHGRDWALQEWPGVVLADGTAEIAVKTRTLVRWAERLGADAEPPLTFAPATSGPTRVLTGSDAAERLSGVRMEWPAETLVADEDTARALLPTFEYPVVAKAAVGLGHRLAAGGVLTGLADAIAAQAAFQLLHRRFGSAVTFCRQVEHAEEYVLGFERSPQYGALLMFGLGGTQVGGAVTFMRAPATGRQFAAVVADHVADHAARAALVETAQSFQQSLAEQPDIASADLNPLTVVGGTVVCLDGKVYLGDPGTADGR